MWSEPGKGSTFTLRLPAADLPQRAGSSAVPDAGHEDGRASRPGKHDGPGDGGDRSTTNEEVGA
jgi:two-component system sensor histidine kinase SenX3